MWQKFGAGIWEALAKKYPSIDMAQVGVVRHPYPAALLHRGFRVRDVYHPFVRVCPSSSTLPDPAMRRQRPRTAYCQARQPLLM